MSAIVPLFPDLADKQILNYDDLRLYKNFNSQNSKIYTRLLCSFLAEELFISHPRLPAEKVFLDECLVELNMRFHEFAGYFPGTKRSK